MRSDRDRPIRTEELSLTLMGTPSIGLIGDLIGARGTKLLSARKGGPLQHVCRNLEGLWARPDGGKFFAFFRASDRDRSASFAERVDDRRTEPAYVEQEIVRKGAICSRRRRWASTRLESASCAC